MTGVPTLSPEHEGRMNQLIDITRPFYDTPANYHDFDIHPLNETRPMARRLVTLCQESGVPIDAEMVDVGAVTHDISALSELTERYFNTKEERAGRMAEMLAVVVGFPDRIVNGVAETVRTTAFKEDYTSNEGGVLGLADMINQTMPKEVRYVRTYDHWQETRLWAPQPPTLTDYLDKCPAILAGFIMKELPSDLRRVKAICYIQDFFQKHLDELADESVESFLAVIADKIPKLEDDVL